MPTTVTWAIDGTWADFDSPWEFATFTWTSGISLTWEQALYPWATFPFFWATDAWLTWELATYPWDAHPGRWDYTSAEHAPIGRTMDINAEVRTYRIQAPN